VPTGGILRIIAEILQIVMDDDWEGASRTSIMYESYLSLLIEK
jgi:hypothetical protein